MEEFKDPFDFAKEINNLIEKEKCDNFLLGMVDLDDNKYKRLKGQKTLIIMGIAEGFVAIASFILFIIKG